MSSIKSKLAVALFAVTALVGAQSAYATMQLTLSASTGGSVTVLDGGAGDSNPAAGVITFIGVIGVWTINVSTGTAPPRAVTFTSRPLQVRTAG